MSIEELVIIHHHGTVLNWSGRGLKHLSEDIEHEVEVESLYLDNNELTRLPDSIGRMKKLKHLSVRYNRIERLPESFRQLDELEVLAVDNNPLQHYPSEYFPDYGRSLREFYLDQDYMPSLKELHVDLDQLKHVPKILIDRRNSGRLEIYADGEKTFEEGYPLSLSL